MDGDWCANIGDGGCMEGRGRPLGRGLGLAPFIPSLAYPLETEPGPERGLPVFVELTAVEEVDEVEEEVR